MVRGTILDVASSQRDDGVVGSFFLEIYNSYMQLYLIDKRVGEEGFVSK